MAENFLHRPFTRRVPEASVPLASPREQLQHLQSLRFQDAQDVGAWNFRYVVRVVVGVLAGFGSAHGGTSFPEMEVYRWEELPRTAKSVNLRRKLASRIC